MSKVSEFLNSKKVNHVASKVMEERRNPQLKAETPPKSQMSHFAIKDLFAEFKKRYLHKWTSQFQSPIEEQQVMNFWAQELADVSAEHLAKAMKVVSDRYLEWPPTIGQFKQMCFSFGKYKEYKDIEKEELPSKFKINSVTPLIDAGAVVCKKLKILYPELNWYQIADVFTTVKKKIRPLVNFKTALEFLNYLGEYSVEDLNDALGS